MNPQKPPKFAVRFLGPSPDLRGVFWTGEDPETADAFTTRNVEHAHTWDTAAAAEAALDEPFGVYESLRDMRDQAEVVDIANRLAILDSTAGRWNGELHYLDYGVTGFILESPEWGQIAISLEGDNLHIMPVNNHLKLRSLDHQMGVDLKLKPGYHKQLELEEQRKKQKGP